MSSTLTYRPATGADMPRIAEIIGQAQAQMRALGSDQWQNGYPAAADIERDIERGAGYVLCDSEANRAETVVAYAAVIFDGEPAYELIDGRWLVGGSYVVVHRLAVADGQKGRGVATGFMCRIAEHARERGVEAFRVDTNFDNRYMLHMLRTLGFDYCGKISYQSGERLAFEKRL